MHNTSLRFLSVSLVLAAIAAAGCSTPSQNVTFPTSNSMDEVSGDGQSGTAGAALPVPIVVKVVDANGNPVKGATVVFDVTAGGGSAGSSIASTDATGQAQTTWTLGLTAGPNQLDASSSGVTGSPLHFQATGKAGAATTLQLTSGDGQSGAAGTTLAQALVVTALDANTNPVPGVSLIFSADNAATLSGAQATTDAQGRASAKLTLGVSAGLNHVTVSGASLSAIFTESGVPGPAALAAMPSAGSGNNQTGAAGTALGSPLVVLVTDQNGNPVPGAQVLWEVAQGGGSLSGAVSLTNAAGKAQASLVLGQKAGANSVTASVAGAGGSPVTFAATGTAGAAAQLSAVSGGGQQGTAGGALAAPFVVVATDAFQNPVAGVAVTFLVANGGGNLSATSVTTGANGQAASTLTLGALAGGNMVTAGVSGLTGSPVSFSATGNAGAAASVVALSGNGQAVAVGTAAAPLVAQVLDVNGNPVPGVSVTFSVSAGGGTLSSTTGTTNAAGQASTVLTLGSTAGANTVKAAAGGTSVLFTLTGKAGAAATFSASSGGGQTGTVATTLATPLSVTVVDAGANPVPGTTVTFAVASGGGSLSSTSAVTNAAGVAQVTLTLGARAGTAADVVTASAPGVANSPVIFSENANAGPATQLLAVSGNGQQGTVTLALANAFTVEALDVYGNPVPNVAVGFAVTAGGGSLSAGSVNTNAAGQAASTLTLGSTAGTDSVAASLAGAGTVTFGATALAAAVKQVVLSAGNGQQGVAGTTLSAPLTAMALDAFGNPVPGATMTFAVTGGGGSLSATSVTTGANGQASTSLTLGTRTGANTVSATSNGFSSSFGETGVAGAAFQISFSSGAGQSGAEGSTLAQPFAVLVDDVNGNPVAGVNVTFAVSGGGGSLSTQQAVSNAAGIASSTLTLGSKAGPNSVNALASGLVGSPVGFSAIGTVGAPSQITVVSGSGQQGTAGSVLPSPLVVQVSDNGGNPVAGVTVNFAVASGGGSIPAPSSVITNASGQGSVSLILGAVSGPNSVTASAAGAGSVTFSAFGNVGPASQLVLLSGNNQSAPAGQSLPGALVVAVRDANGNGVPGVNVSFAVTAGGGFLGFGPGSSTNSQGQALTTLTLGSTPGLNTVSASADGSSGALSGSPITFSANGLPGPAVSGAFSGFPNPALGGVPVTATVTVFDARGFRASGYTGTVHFTSSDASAALPANYTFTGADAGQHVFTFTFNAAAADSVGSLPVSVSFQDTAGNTPSGSTAVNVQVAPPSLSAASVPGGTLAACVPITYTLSQPHSVRSDLTVGYDAKGDGVFQTATECGAVSGTTFGGVRITGTRQVTTSPGGTQHVFLWNTNGDFKGQSVSGLRLQLTPSIRGHKGTPVLVTGVGLSNALSFGAASSVTTGGSPNSVVAADVNGDGLPDLIVPNFGAGTVSVLLQQGNGSFANASGSPITVGSGPSYVAVADYNRDGKLDLAVTNFNSGTVSVLRGNGDGTFTAFAGSPIAVGTNPAGIAAGDLNGDGKVDLVVANWAGGTSAGRGQVLIGNGDGTFAPQPAFAISSTAAPWNLALADLNRDGKLDLIVVNQDSALVACNTATLFGNGAGGFGGVIQTFTGLGCAQNVAVADLNGDGFLDAVLPNASSSNSWVLVGSTFSPGFLFVNQALSMGVPTTFVSVGDVNGDGHPDAVFVANNSQILVTPGTGNATNPISFLPVSFTVGSHLWADALVDVNRDGALDVVAADGSVTGVSVSLNTQAALGDPTLAAASGSIQMAGAQRVGMAVADLDGDGKPDVAQVFGYGGTQVLQGEGDATFTSISTVFAGAGNYVGAVLADMNGDGKPDFVLLDQQHASVQVALGSGFGSFFGPSSFATGPSPSGVAVGDLNGDGFPDLVVANQANATVSVFPGLGDGTLGIPTVYPVDSGPSAVAVADVNGDGILDIVTSNQGGGDVSVLLGTGGGKFGPPNQLSPGGGPHLLVSVAVADVNGDGFPDLIVGDQSAGGLQVFFGGSFGLSSFPSFFPSTVGGPTFLATGDLDGDGVADVVVANGNGGEQLFLGSPSRGLVSTQSTFVAGPVGGLALADMNGDGLLDVVIQQNDTLLVQAGNGAGLLRSAAIVTGLGASLPGATGDFNRDGKPDFLVLTPGSSPSQLTFFAGDGTGGFNGGSFLVPGTSSPTALAVGDLNGDGIPDLVMAAQGSNNVVACLGNASGPPTCLAPFAVGANPQGLALGDFNGDGKLDLAVSCLGSNTVQLFTGNGNGNFAAGPTPFLSTGSGPFDVYLADMNGDGALDVVVLNRFSNTVQIFPGLGNGNFGGAATVSISAAAGRLSIADLNRDGKPDLVVGDCCDGYAQVFLSQGSLAFGPALFSYLGSATSNGPLAVTDMNRDGKLDLVVPGNGDAVNVCYGDGAGHFTREVAYGPGGRWVLSADFNGDGLPDVVTGDANGNGIYLMLAR